MKWPYAILLTLALLGVSLAITLWTELDLVLLMIVATTAWAAYDSSRIQLMRYESGISYEPAILFVAIGLLWIVGFPWYLIVRGRILRGEQPFKAGEVPEVLPIDDRITKGSDPY